MSHGWAVENGGREKARRLLFLVPGKGGTSGLSPDSSPLPRFLQIPLNLPFRFDSGRGLHLFTYREYAFFRCPCSWGCGPFSKRAACVCCAPLSLLAFWPLVAFRLSYLLTCHGWLCAAQAQPQARFLSPS